MTAKSAKRAPGAGTVRGGRLDAAPSDLMDAINVSIDVDKRLHAEDIAASKAHCAMLVRQGIISEADGDAILGGLDTIGKEIEDGRFLFHRSLEDIHMNVE
ncbi:MAG: argininosuccinate lyase, partial [Proteobacteria bacterium]|nr:argininosuccinate lyase [Pseudomonadota bacterium]